jgi:hypothetical protein
MALSSLSGFRGSRFRNAKFLRPQNPRYADGRPPIGPSSDGTDLLHASLPDGRLRLILGVRDF